MRVTEMSHVRRMFVEGHARLVAMKLFALRAADYMRAASSDDRRYLLYNPMVKMKVTTQGEAVIDLLLGRDRGEGLREGHVLQPGGRGHPRAAQARGHGPREHRPDREVHAELLLRSGRVSRRSGARTTTATTTSSSTRGARAGLGQIRFHDYRKRLRGRRAPERARSSPSRPRPSARCSQEAPPGPDQMKDVDFLMAGGEIFALVVYAQLILENRTHLRPSTTICSTRSSSSWCATYRSTPSQLLGATEQQRDSRTRAAGRCCASRCTTRTATSASGRRTLWRWTEPTR